MGTATTQERGRKDNIQDCGKENLKTSVVDQAQRIQQFEIRE